MKLFETYSKKKKRFFDFHIKLFGHETIFIIDIPNAYLKNYFKSASLGAFSFVVVGLTIAFINFVLVWASLGFIMAFLGLPFPEFYFIVFLYVLRAFWKGKLFRMNEKDTGAIL